MNKSEPKIGNSFLTQLRIFLIILIHVFACVCVWFMWGGKRATYREELILFFQHAGHGAQTQVVSLGDKFLYPLSHPAKS